MIQATKVKKSYKNKDFFKAKEVSHALKGISLTIPPNEVFGIIGMNGAGKSTFLKLLLHLMQPDSGTLQINGKAVSTDTVRQQVGYLPENPYLYDQLTPVELLQFSLKTSRPEWSAKKSTSAISHWLEKVALAPFQKQKIRTFSKGMTQRLGIAFAFCHDPEILILDEPMSGLDPFGRKLIIDLIQTQKKEGKTVLFCSHILSDVEKICDQVAILHKGSLKTILTRNEIKRLQNQILVRTDLAPTKPILWEHKAVSCGMEITCSSETLTDVISWLAKQNGNVLAVIPLTGGLEEIFFDITGEHP